MNPSLCRSLVRGACQHAALLGAAGLVLSGCGESGPTGSGGGGVPYLFRETLTDQADGISCSDRGTITLSQSGSSLSGTLKQTGSCTGPTGSVDNSGSGPVAGGLGTGTAIQFQAASCQYHGATVGNPFNGASGAVSCNISQNGHTFPFSGEWRFSAGVASVSITPNPVAVESGRTVQLSAVLRDPGGSSLSGRTVTWTTSDPAVASVDASGRVTGMALGATVVTATSVPVFPLEDPQSEPAPTRVFVVFTSVSAGVTHTCALTRDQAAYCWGWELNGQLGNNTPGSDYQTTPVLVSGGLRFASLDVGVRHACGVTTGHAAYCWGRGMEGQLGDGTGSSFSPFPVAVSGGIQFTSVSAGNDYTCGVSTGGAAYCWGLNNQGQLGNGTTANSLAPAAVSGGLTFSSISAGQGDPGAHTCGVTTTGAAYCWGLGFSGQIGDLIGGQTNVPSPVMGGLTFTSVSTGAEHTCGVASGGAGYCWGDNLLGQLGNGSTANSGVPVAVLGGLTFASLTAGGAASCGVTTAAAAYCWGGGQLLGTGNVPYQPQATPAPVAGGLLFSGLSAGNRTICGVTTTQVAYCWGRGVEGQLGNGSVDDEAAPVVVSGQQ